jgi:predicted nucleic acid-binding protein
MPSTQPPAEIVICDTTPVRYFAIVDRMDLLARLSGGTVRVPREVFDPGEDMSLPDVFLSELGKTERYLSRKQSTNAGADWSRIRALRLRTDIEVVDLDFNESGIAAEVSGRRYLQRFGLAGRLGKGESAVIAAAGSRGWHAAMDDRAGRTVLAQRFPHAGVSTVRDLLRRATFAGMFPDPPSRNAQALYDAMLQANYLGPPDLFIEPR